MEFFTNKDAQTLVAAFEKLGNDGFVPFFDPKKGINVKYHFGSQKDEYIGLDGRVAPPAEVSIWQSHMILQDGVAVADLSLLLVTKMRAAATRRNWQFDLKVPNDIGDVSVV